MEGRSKARKLLKAKQLKTGLIKGVQDKFYQFYFICKHNKFIVRQKVYVWCDL